MMDKEIQRNNEYFEKVFIFCFFSIGEAVAGELSPNNKRDQIREMEPICNR